MKSRISVVWWVLVVFASSGITLAANEPTLHTGPKAILYRFTGGADGAHPNRGVILGSAGNLHGITPGTPFGGKDHRMLSA